LVAGTFLYREPFKTDIPGTLDAIRKLGVRDIEFSNLFNATAAVMRRLLDERGMTCSSYGVGYEALIKSPDAVAADAKTLGARFVRVAWIPHQAPFTADHARAAAADFNRVGRVLRERHGLTFCYHNHGYEFAPHGDGTLFDLLAAETDPADVAFEIDILWAHFGGADPAAVIERYGSRVKLLHWRRRSGADRSCGFATSGCSCCGRPPSSSSASRWRGHSCGLAPGRPRVAARSMRSSSSTTV
jgi:sugar phosphate isomerase/epimerase